LKKGGLTVLEPNCMEWLCPDILFKLNGREYGA
jgi:hypothetical protein